MSKVLDNMGNARNEKREQNIFKLRKAFDDLDVVTVAQASQHFGYQPNTIIKWAKVDTDGHVAIPLIIDNQSTVVPLTPDNQPKSLPLIKNAGEMFLAYLNR